MRRRILLAIIFVVFMLPGPPSCNSARADEISIIKPVVVIDSGHTNKIPGAISITGKHEVEYNDTMVSKLSFALTRAGFVPILTCKPNQDSKLEDRASIANSYNAVAMLSIHHDSAQLVHLETVKLNGRNTYRTHEPISGYSIFVSKKNPQFDSSYILAKLLGQELLKLGRKPALHHAEPIPGEGRPLLDRNLGIYQFDDLVVLKKSKVPAVLLEIGVVVDKFDEAYVTRTDHQESIVNAIVVSIGKFNKPHAGKP